MAHNIACEAPCVAVAERQVSTAASTEGAEAGSSSAFSQSCVSEDPAQGCLSGHRDELLIFADGKSKQHVGLHRVYKDVEVLKTECDKEVLARQFLLAAQDSKLQEMRAQLDTEQQERAAFESRQTDVMHQFREHLESTFNQYTQMISDRLAEARDAADNSQLVAQRLRHSMSIRLSDLERHCSDLERRCSSLERRVVEIVDVQASGVIGMREQHEKISKELETFRSGQRSDACQVQNLLNSCRRLESFLTLTEGPIETLSKEQLPCSEHLPRASQVACGEGYLKRSADIDQLAKYHNQSSAMQDSQFAFSGLEVHEKLDAQVMGIAKKIMDDATKISVASMLQDVAEPSEASTEVKTPSQPSSSQTATPSQPSPLQTVGRSPSPSQTTGRSALDSYLASSASHENFVTIFSPPKLLRTSALSSSLADSAQSQSDLRNLSALSSNLADSAQPHRDALMRSRGSLSTLCSSVTHLGGVLYSPESQEQAEMQPEKRKPMPRAMDQMLNPYGAAKPSWSHSSSRMTSGADRSRSARRRFDDPEVPHGSRFVIKTALTPRIINTKSGVDTRRVVEVAPPFQHPGGKPLASSGSSSSIAGYQSRSCPMLPKESLSATEFVGATKYQACPTPLPIKHITI